MPLNVAAFTQNVHGALGPVERSQNVSIGASSVQTAATLGPDDTFQYRVRLVATAACYIKFGADPTAQAGDLLVPADVEVWLWAMGSDKLAVIEVGS